MTKRLAAKGTRWSRSWRRLRLVELEDRTVPSNSIPLNATGWTALGPAPINHGQTNGNLAVSGRIDGVAGDPTNADILYVASAGGGVWKTTDATAANPSWTPVTETQPTQITTGIAVAPSNPSVVYVATGDGDGTVGYFGRGILKSIDGGSSWTLLSDNGTFNGQTVQRIVVDPTNANTVYATVGAYFDDGAYGTLPTAAGVYKSTDGGTTWTNTTSGIAPSQPWSSVIMDPMTPTTLYAATSNLYSDYPGGTANGVYKTINGGASWSLVGGLPSGTAVGRISLALAAGAPGTVYMCYATTTDFALAGVYRSIDAGGSWTNVTPGPPQNQVFGAAGAGQGNYDNVISVDPTDANVAYIGGSFQTAVIRTVDGGTTWTTVGDNQGLTVPGPHGDLHAMAYDANGRLLTGTDGGLFAYIRSTNTWGTLNGSAASGGLNTIQAIEVALHPTDPNVAFVANQDNGIARFNDSLGWSLPSGGGDGGAVSVDPNNPGNVYFIYSGNDVRRSTDGGTTFFPASAGLPPGGFNFYPPMVIDPGNTSRLLFGANSVYTSTNAAGWSVLGTNPGIGTIDAIGIGASSGSTIYVGGSNNSTGVFSVRVSTDDGASWGGVTPPGGTRRFVDFAVDPVDSAKAYVVNNSLTGTHVWRTGNSGASWTAITGTGLPDEQFQSIAFDAGPTGASADDRLFVGTVGGVYASTNFTSASPTWTRFGAGLPNVVVRDLKIAPATGILAAGTYGRGLWEILINPPSTVASLRVNDAAGQRSEVRSLAVTFSGPVTFAGGNANAAAAFQLKHVQTGNNVVLSAVITTDSLGRTVVTFGFSGSETDPVSGLNGGVPSLADGRYQLTILGNAVNGPGGIFLDGDGDGSPGGNYVSPTDTYQGSGLHLYRLFGDASGDGVVDATDLGQFRSTFNANTTNPFYLSFLDADNSGAVDASDLGQFRSRFNLNVF
jgi:hypothetical protein